MKTLQLTTITLLKDHATITGNIVGISFVEAMNSGSELFSEIQDIVNWNNCTLTYKLEVTINPANVKATLIIDGDNANKVISAILKNP